LIQAKYAIVEKHAERPIPGAIASSHSLVRSWDLFFPISNSFSSSSSSDSLPGKTKPVILINNLN
jgi:hypothetical protein